MIRRTVPKPAAKSITMKPTTITEALADPELFGGMFDAPSWGRWIVFLKALFGLPLTPPELVIFRYHTARQTAPTKASRYAELVCGRRGGKSRILSLIATFLACCLDHRPYLVPGETPVVAVIAKDRDQAKVILNYVIGFLQEVPAFASMIVDELAESVKLSNRVVIEVHTASLAAPRGRTFLAVLADEIAFWPSGDSANPDVEVVNAVRPGLSTIPYSLLLLASSPYAKRGVLYVNYAKYFGVDDGSVLVWQGSTAEMNETLVDDEVAADMYLTDPDRASAEYGAQFRSDIAAFLTREALEAVLPRGVVELPAGGGISYTAFVDPSGGSNDSMTMAVAHLEPDGTAVLDAVRERRPPFSPDEVTQEFAELMKAYGVSRCHGDRYAGMWPRERFAVHGISYEISERTKSQIYQEFLPALNGRRVRLLDHPRMISQFVTLERRTARGGRDSIDHEDGAKDDVANSAAGVLVQVLEDRRPALIKQTDLMAADKPVEHRFTELVFGTLWVGIDGMCGWALFSYCSYATPKLIVADFDVVPWSGSVVSDLATRLNALCDDVAARSNLHQQPSAIMHVPSQLMPAATDAMLNRFEARLYREFAAAGRQTRVVDVKPIRAEYLADPVRLLLNAGAHVSAGSVKLSGSAMERAAGKPLLGALAVRPGEAVDNDPLRLAILLGVVQLDAKWRPMTDANIQFR